MAKESGSNKILPYNWEANKWYKMVIHCWDDEETGNTFVGQWVQNIETGEWDLISYFDTKLKKSYIMGGLSQFLENYSDGNADKERDINIKNMYARDYENNKWISLNKSRLSYSEFSYEKNSATGKHEFGVEDDYFWGLTGGTVEDQEAYREIWKKKVEEEDQSVDNLYKINQPDTPTLGNIQLSSVKVDKNNGDYVIKWNYEDESTPQVKYNISIVDESGNVIKTEEATRPEINSYTYSGEIKEGYEAVVTVTDIFGNEDKGSVDLSTGNQRTPTPQPAPKPRPEEQPNGENKDNGNSDGKEESSNKNSASNNGASKSAIPYAGSTVILPIAIIISVFGTIIARKHYKKHK